MLACYLLLMEVLEGGCGEGKEFLASSEFRPHQIEHLETENCDNVNFEVRLP